MPSDEIAISVKNLTKKYRIFGHPGDRIKQALTLGRVRFHREFTALQGVSFEIKKGETVGIIGRNGSGKSTLLQLICGILKPTSGEVKVNGRISALLELGAGFNPEFTGRENVYFQGALTGLCKEEMDLRFDEIAAFADIGEFIDQQVRTYSSGMFVRLAFSVAISLDPDVLIVDEALSVGDERFQRKVMARLGGIQKEGVTVLIVSHSSSTIGRLCQRTIVLDKGHLCVISDAREGIKKYHELLYTTKELTARVQDGVSEVAEGLSGARDLRGRITRAHLESENGTVSSVFGSGQTAILAVEIEILGDLADVQVGISINTMDGYTAFGTNTSCFNRNISMAKAGSKLTVRFMFCLNLCEGTYSISVAMATTALPNGFEYIDRRSDIALVTITDSQRIATGIANLPVSLDISIT